MVLIIINTSYDFNAKINRRPETNIYTYIYINELIYIYINELFDKVINIKTIYYFTLLGYCRIGLGNVL